jgi:peroxiredoxin
MDGDQPIDPVATVRALVERARGVLSGLPPWSSRAATLALVVATLAVLARALLTPAPPASLSSAPGPAAPAINHYAPDVTLLDASGNRVRLSSLRGSVVVLNFWYAACEPCRSEMPTLERAFEQHQKGGLVVVGVDVADDAQTMTAFARALGVSYPVFRDDQGSAFSAFQLSATPSTFVIDRAGVIRYQFVGPADGDTLRQEAASLLATS